MTSSDEISHQIIEPDFVRPRLRVFLSIDLIGSTAFKQKFESRRQTASSDEPSNPADSFEPWLWAFAEFYRDFEYIFRREWESFKKLELPMGNEPQLWKAVGDELIYMKELNNDFEEAVAIVQIWRQTLLEYRKQLKSKHMDLDIKSTAWLAGFPIQNSEIAFSSNNKSNFGNDIAEDRVLYNFLLLSDYYKKESSNVVIDFAGPAMDTGFRLCQLATARKFVISADLAYCLVRKVKWWTDECVRRTDARYETRYLDLGLNFGYDGLTQIRGVLGDRKYPIIWLDMIKDIPQEYLFESDQTEVLNDTLLDRPKTDNTDDLKKLLEIILKEDGEFPSRPYISRESDEKPPQGDEIYYNPPTSHTDRLHEIREYLIDAHKKIIREQIDLVKKSDTSDKNEDLSIEELSARLVEIAKRAFKEI